MSKRYMCVCEQFAHSRYMQVEWPGDNSRPSDCGSNIPNSYTTTL